MSESKSSPSKVTVKVTATASPSSKKSGGGKPIYRSKARIQTHLNTGRRK